MRLHPVLTGTLLRVSGALFFVFLICRTFAAGRAEEIVTIQPPRPAPLRVVIKADDLTDERGGVAPGWRRFEGFVVERRMKVGIGIITRSLEGEKPVYFDWIKHLHGTGLVEFWNHGYDHKRWTGDDGVRRWDFSGTDEPHQKAHLATGQTLARSKLGIIFRTFGAPFNETDGTTLRLLAADPDLKVWLYGDTAKAPPNVFAARRPAGLPMEPTALKPDFSAFVTAFERRRGGDTDRPYLVLQGHPAHWDAEGFAGFVRIVDYLTEKGAVFVTPLELAEAMTGMDATKE